MSVLNVVQIVESFWADVRVARNPEAIDLGQLEPVPGLKSHITGLWQAGGNMGAISAASAAADYETFDPASTPAAEVRVVPSKHFYLKSEIFSRNRNSYHDDINGLHLVFRDSPVVATEFGDLLDPTPSATEKLCPGTHKFGTTTNPGRFNNLATGAREAICSGQEAKE
jgi:hypothetical protein